MLGKHTHTHTHTHTHITPSPTHHLHVEEQLLGAGQADGLALLQTAQNLRSPPHVRGEGERAPKTGDELVEKKKKGEKRMQLVGEEENAITPWEQSRWQT